MNLMSELKEINKNSSESILEVLIGFFTRDPITFGEAIIRLLKEAKSIPDIIFWTNFSEFLKEGKFDDEKLRKLAAKLVEDGNNKDNATKIIYAINAIDEPSKAKYISWLTVAVIHDMMALDEYFRLIKVVSRLINSDLIFIADNVEKVLIDTNDCHVEDFLANGLLRSVDGGFAYSERAYNLVEYGIRYGHSVRRPEHIPDRQVVPTDDYGDLEEV